MNKTNKIIVSFFAIAVFLGSCKKQLDVKNPNEPNPETIKTEFGILADRVEFTPMASKP